MTLAQVVEKAKSSTSKWLKTKGPTNFSWQAGYGAFSVSQGHADRVNRLYSRARGAPPQAEFEDELRQMFADAGIEHDERYVWD